jgi:tRNA C32,U32 (ribose-2'-O)-methylase TrmJ
MPEPESSLRGRVDFLERDTRRLSDELRRLAKRIEAQAAEIATLRPVRNPDDGERRTDGRAR